MNTLWVMEIGDWRYSIGKGEILFKIQKRFNMYSVLASTIPTSWQRFPK